MAKEKVKVLYLDDEQHNLNSFKAAFRRRYDVFIAINSDEAMQILSENEIHVLITDQRMPEITGVEFLEKVRKTYDKPVRILLTGYADIEAVIGAINKGKVFHYISKPWNDDEVIHAIESAHDVYCLREEKDKELNFFVYKASHDLKGPLVSMSGLVHLVRKEITDQKAVQLYMDLISTSINRLDDILSELIDYKRVDQAVISYVDIDFKELIEGVIESIQHSNESKKVEFRLNVNQSNSFKSDHGILRSVLQNLIENAVKYSKADSSVSSYVAINVDVSESNVEIQVKDNGVGMPEEIKQNIFKMFYRGQRDAKGSGLGLYIVKTGLEKIGGQIEVESELGRGSLFTINLNGPTDLTQLD